MNRLRHLMTLLFTFMIVSMLPENVFAASNFHLLGQLSSGPSVNYVFEAGIVVLLFGGALFAVCKTSYRR